MSNPKCDRCNKKITGSYIMDKEGTFHHMCHNPKPQTADNELPKPQPKKLNREKLHKLAQSIRKDMESQTADEVLADILMNAWQMGANNIAFDKEEIAEAKAALLAGLLEKKQLILKHDGTDGVNVTNYIEAVPVDAIKEYFEGSDV